MSQENDQAGRFSVTVEREPRAEDVDLINASLDQFNRAFAGDDHHQPLAIFLRDPETGDIAGGLVGVTFWDWLHIDLLWIREDLRGEGYGHQLVEQAEDEARRRGCRGAFLSTLGFQAPGFYERLGYSVFGELPDLPPGFVRYYLKKEL